MRDDEYASRGVQETRVDSGGSIEVLFVLQHDAGGLASISIKAARPLDLVMISSLAPSSRNLGSGDFCKLSSVSS